MLLLNIPISLSRVSNAAHAMCGVIKQFFAVSNGLSFAGGSVDSTSTPAPAIFPEFSASARAFSSTTGPREVFMINAVFLHLLRNSAFTVFSVSFVRGQWNVIMSAFSARSSRFFAHLKFLRALWSVT